MTTAPTDVDPGRCPVCETTIPPTNVLIEYEGSDGWTAFAECPACDVVVRPH